MRHARSDHDDLGIAAPVWSIFLRRLRWQYGPDQSAFASRFHFDIEFVRATERGAPHDLRAQEALLRDCRRAPAGATAWDGRLRAWRLRRAHR